MICCTNTAYGLLHKSVIALKILVFTLLVSSCNSYPTVITSNFTSQVPPQPPTPPLPEPPQPQPQPNPPTPPPPPPLIKYPLMQVQTIQLIKNSGPKMGGLPSETSRNMTWTFKEQFQNISNLKVFATIIQIEDDAKRLNIVFYLQMLDLTNTNVIVKYNDFSKTKIFGSVAVGVKLKLRGIVFDTSKCLGFDFVQVLAQLLDDALYSQTITTPFELNENTLIVSYINRLTFSLPIVGNYFVLPKINLVSDKNKVNLQINGQFVNIIPKVAGIIIVFMKNTEAITVSSGKLSLTQKNASITLQDKMYYIIGLTSFKRPKDDIINIDITSQLDKIKNTYSGSNYDLSLDYGIIGDITPQLDPNYLDPELQPTPDPHPEPNPSPAQTPTPESQTRPQTVYRFTLTSIISFSYFNNTFQIVYQNVPNIGKINLSQFEIYSFPLIQKVNISYDNGRIVVVCSYQDDIRGIPISAQLKWIKNDVLFTATTNLNLQIFPPLKIYSNLSKKYLIGSIADIIQYLYLTAFIISLLSRKLIGIEMMSFIQLTFYSLIPLGPLTPFFSGLYKMKYVSGINMKFDNLIQTKIPLTYSNLALNSNFLCNINIMYLPVIICPIIFGILHLASNYNQSYKHKPRLKLYAVASICEWIFAFIMFNSYNIYISFVINIQNLGTSEVIPLVIGLLISLTPLGVIIIYYIFQSHYQQFNSQLNFSYKRLNFKSEQTKKITIMYPLVLGLQMIMIPIALSNQIIFNNSLYFALAVALLINLFVWIIRPYNQKLDNIRVSIQRSLVILMIVILIICKAQININSNPDSIIMNLVWIILLLLLIGFLINFPFIIWQLVLWIKQKGDIDHKMYLNHKSKTQKLQAQIPSKFQKKDPLYYPILEYGQNLKIKERQKKKRLSLANVNVKVSKSIDKSLIEDNVNIISYQEIKQSAL